MHIRHKIAQMLMMGFEGCAIDAQSPVASWLINDGLGGVILFDKDAATRQNGKNLKSRAQISHLTHKLQAFSAQGEKYRNNKPNPLLIAIDYEGGAVDRLADIPGSLSTYSALEQGLLAPEVFQYVADKMARELKLLGFNLNFAPVVDLNLNNEEGIIGRLQRSFSDNPHKVIDCARSFIHAFKKHGLLSTLKHFPGHGSAAGDTHIGFVDVTERFQYAELFPYEVLLKEFDTSLLVMTAHVVNHHLDPNHVPATLSYPIITNLLRKQLGFAGVVISDDLQMQAISRGYSLLESLEKSVNAGADMLIFANQLGTITPDEIIDNMIELVKGGKISVKRIDESWQRIMQCKEGLAKSMSDSLLN